MNTTSRIRAGHGYEAHEFAPEYAVGTKAHAYVTTATYRCTTCEYALHQLDMTPFRLSNPCATSSDIRRIEATASAAQSHLDRCEWAPVSTT